MAINGPNGPIDPGSMNPETMQSLPPEAMSGCTAGDMQQMPPPCMGGCNSGHITHMPPEAMGGCSADHMTHMPRKPWVEWMRR